VTDVFADGPPAAVGTETTTLGTCDTNTETSFSLCSEGDIDVYDAHADPYVGSPNVAQDVAAIVISHGNDHYDALQSDHQKENFERNPAFYETTTNYLSAYTPGDYTSGTFVYKEYSKNVTDGVDFDDMMIWISPIILKNQLVSVGKLP
jgi:hypothetical protein